MKIKRWDGKKISEPGIYDGIPMDIYHGDLCIGPSVSSSDLRTIFIQSPAHYFETSYLNTSKEDEDEEDEEVQKENANFVLGRAAHHLLLGEDDFSTQFIVRPEEAPDGRAWNGNNNSCKAWIAHQTDAGRTILTRKQIKVVRGMARSLAKHPLIEAGILNGHVEKSIVWRDKQSGVWLKSRPDVIPNDSGDVADLKTTAAMDYDFDNDGSKFRYDMQAALTKWGLKETLNLEMQSFSFVPVLKKAPHCCDVLTLQGEDIIEAEKDLRISIEIFANCLKTGNWFGPSGTQSDARFFVFKPYIRERAQLRRDFLQRELERETAANQPTQAEYAAVP